MWHFQRPPTATTINTYVDVAVSSNSQRVAFLGDHSHLQIFTSDLKVAN